MGRLPLTESQSIPTIQELSSQALSSWRPKFQNTATPLTRQIGLSEWETWRASELARQVRDRVAAEMTPSQIEEAQRLAREWLAAHP